MSPAGISLLVCVQESSRKSRESGLTVASPGWSVKAAGHSGSERKNHSDKAPVVLVRFWFSPEGCIFIYREPGGQ